ncbi:hydrogenase formation protein HypD [Desulfobacter latus]|uniref:Hydrogenase formation protein HypD n=2 Tax=Desulfobacter latus TaxID=2292 RepID=A0A850T171_9BACT|nr:hydrogenase formation protein HypD [Desulfobacter latus]NWH05453.1 hydrogenase formation protein HypD [Desulfobacter latus]
MNLTYNQVFKDPEISKALVARIREKNTRPLRLMEVCGTHTMAIFRYGIRSVLPETITLLSGPGCPVCVIAQKDIDAYVMLARRPDVILTTFGDLMKVPGSVSSLAGEKAKGADVRMVYSIFDALAIAKENPDKAVVFCAVGFETTIPTIAGAVLTAQTQGIDNFSIYSANKLTPPALAALMKTAGVEIDGFILPGHVAVITGLDAFYPIFEKYRIPSVVTGFEPMDILNAVLKLVEQNESKIPRLVNAYPRAVADAGNPKARAIMDQVFETADALWRGIGHIPDSGMVLRESFYKFDAAKKFELSMPDTREPAGCDCGRILMGLKRPDQCRLYKKNCTPMHPVGPCMVSSEGACAAFYKYSG